MAAPNPTHIYHITHFKNLDSILKLNGLTSVTSLRSGNLSYENIAFNDIQARRNVFEVPVSPYGNLHDYVPFYFAPRSPMLYTINRGNVPNYSDGQGPLIYLVSDAQTVHNKSVPYCFTDGHGIMFFTEYYKALKDLDKVDWDIMKSNFWADTPDDNDRKRRRQAEFLVHKFLPLECIKVIVVMNDNIKSKVVELLSQHNIQIPVFTQKDWYY